MSNRFEEEFDDNDVIEMTRDGLSLIEIKRKTGESIKVIRRIQQDAIHEGYLVLVNQNECSPKLGTVSLSLLVRGGEVPLKSGLNWGLSNAHVSPNDAYIPIRTAHIREGFFQEHGVVLEAIWDDDRRMQLVTEGTQPLDGVGTYPKQLSSYPDKSLLGLYLRERIGVLAPVLITRSDLDIYGRNDILATFSIAGKVSLDFSPG